MNYRKGQEIFKVISLRTSFFTVMEKSGIKDFRFHFRFHLNRSYAFAFRLALCGRFRSGKSHSIDHTAPNERQTRNSYCVNS